MKDGCDKRYEDREAKPTVHDGGNAHEHFDGRLHRRSDAFGREFGEEHADCDPERTADEDRKTRRGERAHDKGPGPELTGEAVPIAGE